MRPPSEDDLLDLVGLIYDCAIDPSGWAAALHRLTDAMRGHDATMTLNNITRPNFSMKAQWNLDPQFEAAMKVNYASNPLLPNVWYQNVDDPFSLLSLMDEDELQGNQWYRRTMGAFGYRDAAISMLAKSTSRFGAVSVQRKAQQPPFSPEDLNLLGRICPHIRRAALIGDILETRLLERDMMSSTLDTLSVGVILTDAKGRIVHSNASARRSIEKATTIWSDGGLLSARHVHTAKDLAQAIGAAGSGTTVDLPRGGVVVSLTGVGDDHDLAAWVLPLDKGLRKDLAATYAAAVAIFIREVGQAGVVPAELFVRRYGITPSECRVLLLMVQGHAARDVADALGVSITTIKTHLSRLLQKTGTKRQTELVRLAMTVMAPVGA